MIDLKRYRKATSYCRSVQLVGFTVGSVLGQLFVSFNLLSYNDMLVFSLVLIAIVLLVSFLLPMPQHSMFFHHTHTTETVETGGIKRHADETVGGGDEKEVEGGETQNDAGNGDEEDVGAESCSRVLLKLWRDFLHCYSSRQLLYWSVWWAVATCGYNQTINYVQVSSEGSMDKNSEI